MLDYCYANDIQGRARRLSRDGYRRRRHGRQFETDAHGSRRASVDEPRNLRKQIVKEGVGKSREINVGDEKRFPEVVGKFSMRLSWKVGVPIVGALVRKSKVSFAHPSRRWSFSLAGRYRVAYPTFYRSYIEASHSVAFRAFAQFVNTRVHERETREIPRRRDGNAEKSNRLLGCARKTVRSEVARRDRSRIDG